MMASVGLRGAMRRGGAAGVAFAIVIVHGRGAKSILNQIDLLKQAAGGGGDRRKFVSNRDRTVILSDDAISQGVLDMAVGQATILISCPDRAGIIARVSNQLFTLGCNIIDSDQHTDADDGHFFWRIFFESADLPIAELSKSLGPSLSGLLPGPGARWELFDYGRHERIVLMVSKLHHCMMDLLSRHHSRELDADVAAVISNHADLEPLVKPFGVPFMVIPISKETKAISENTLVKTLNDLGCDTVVLARYMQILSGDFLRAWGKPIVNIHHSFLPAFVGARPYKQAHERGVKLIGATAHYVTEELDAGPIIAQATAPVTHRDTVAEMTRKGKDLEVIVLAKAVRAHLQKRVLVHHNKTILFK
jgi:formyltetrahydrofolate deformylase